MAVSDGEESRPAVHTVPADVDKPDDAPESDAIYGRLAWPVAESMLQMLAPNKANGGFKSADFVKESFQDAFAAQLTSPAADSSNQNEKGRKVLEHQAHSVVDSVLGAMGFQTTTICERKLSILVDILAALAESRVSCGSYSLASSKRSGTYGGQKSLSGDEWLEGSFCHQGISTSELQEMLTDHIPFLLSGKANGARVLEVIDALVRVATETTLFMPFHTLYRKTVCANEGQTKQWAAGGLQSLVDYALDEKDLIYSKLQPCSRLRIWRIRPLCLKQDLSDLAHEAMERMVLCFSRELADRAEWANLVVCLSLAPDMFTEARRLLHSWFMSTGCNRLWELRANMVAAVWNVLEQPFVWGFVNDIYLPPQHAFYHTSLRPFVQIFRWPPTFSGLVQLVKLLDHRDKLNENSVSIPGPILPGSDFKRERIASQILDQVNHDSTWALLMDFLPWFEFASRTLFKRQVGQLSTSTDYHQKVSATEPTKVKLESTKETVCKVAARYIAWIMNPLEARLRDWDEQMLLQVSWSWDKVQEAAFIGSSSGILASEDPRALQSAVQEAFFKCSKCGVPVWTRRLGDKVQPTSQRTGEAVPSQELEFVSRLDQWLADLQMCLGESRYKTLPDESTYVCKEENSDVEGLAGSRNDCQVKPLLSGVHHKYHMSMMLSLPLAALAESLNFCSHHIVARILHFVGCGGRQIAQFPEEFKFEDQIGLPGVATCKSTSTAIHCEICHGRLNGTHVDGTGNGTPPQVEHLNSSNWIHGVAAVFNFLESMHDDGLQGTNPIESEWVGDGVKRSVDENLAVIVSEFVNQWGSIFENWTGASFKGHRRESSVATLEDMRHRYFAWIRKLTLSIEILRICECAQAILDARIANLRSLLITR